MGDPTQAEDVTQAVFIALARKAAQLRRGTVMAGWLHQTARHHVAEAAPGSLPAAQRAQYEVAQMRAEVEVRPGQITTVTLGNSNYTVTAHLRWPAEVQRDSNWGIFLVLHSRALVPPGERLQELAALATPTAQPETAAAYAHARHPLMFCEETDGQFVADNVSPGDYEVRVSTSMVPAPGGADQRLQAGTPAFITVPSDPPSGTLDLGEIVLQSAN